MIYFWEVAIVGQHMHAFGWGQYLNDVRTEGGESKNTQIMRTNSLRNTDKGGGGVKKFEHFVDVI